MGLFDFVRRGVDRIRELLPGSDRRQEERERLDEFRREIGSVRAQIEVLLQEQQSYQSEKEWMGPRVVRFANGYCVTSDSASRVLEELANAAAYGYRCSLWILGKWILGRSVSHEWQPLFLNEKSGSGPHDWHKPSAGASAGWLLDQIEFQREQQRALLMPEFPVTPVEPRTRALRKEWLSLVRQLEDVRQLARSLESYIDALALDSFARGTGVNGRGEDSDGKPISKIVAYRLVVFEKRMPGTQARAAVARR